MAAAVHYHKRLTAQVAEKTTFTTKLTVTAAELATAGFVANDEVLVLSWMLLSTSAAGAHVRYNLEYNSTGIRGVLARYDIGGTARERVTLAMYRVDLGAPVADFEISLASTSGVDDAYFEKLEIMIVRLSDFGVENTDWFWNESVANTGHPETFSATGQATITFTPAAVEDWLVFGSQETQIDSVSVSHEWRINMDSGTILGAASTSNNPIEEGEDTNELKDWFMFDYIESLSAAEHTIESEIQDDTTAAQNTRRSALFVFRAAVWADMFVHEAGDVSITQDTNVQVATITDMLSTSQDIVMLGHGFTSAMDFLSSGYFWIRQDGSTVIDPKVDQSGAGLSNFFAYDATDQPMASMLAYLANQSGALDLDLFFHHDGAGSETLHKTTFLVWGMELAGEDDGRGGASDADLLILGISRSSGAARRMIVDPWDKRRKYNLPY